MTIIRLARKLRRLSRWSLILLVVGLPFFLGGVTAAGALFSRIMALVIVGTWVSSMVLEGELRLQRTGLEIPLGLFLLLAATLSLTSAYRYASLAVLAEWGVYAVAFLAAANLFVKDYWMRRLAGAAIVTGTALSMLGLLQYMGMLGHTWWANPALSATYVNKNHFAGFLVMLIPLTLGFCLKTQNFGKRILLNYLFGLLGIALFLSFSKAGWISLLVSLGIMGVCLRYNAGSYRRGVILLLAGAAIFFTLAILVWQPVVNHMLGKVWQQATTGGASLSLRLKLWKMAAQIFCQQPYLGSGPGSFPLVAPGYRPLGLNYLLDYVHNDLLQLGVELGGAGLLLAGYGLVVFFRRSFLYLKRRRNYTLGLRWGAMGGVLALVIHSLVDFQFHLPANGVLCFALAGLVAGGWSVNETSR